MGVVAPGSTCLLDQRREDPMVAGDGSGVRSARCSARPRFDLPSAPPSGRRGRRSGQRPRPIARRRRHLRGRARPTATPSVPASWCSARRGVDHRAVADADHGVPGDTAPAGERDDAEVATLGDECDATGVAQRHSVTPHGCARVSRHEAVGVGSDHRQPVLSCCRDQEVLSIGASGLGEVGREHDCTTAADRPRCSSMAGTVSAGVATTTASTGPASSRVGTHRTPSTSVRVRVNSDQLAGESARSSRLVTAALPYEPGRDRWHRRRRSRWERTVARGPRTRLAAGSAEHRVDAAAFEAARDDQSLDLAGALPDAVDPQLTPEALRDVGAHVAAAAEDLNGTVCTTVGSL